VASPEKQIVSLPSVAAIVGVNRSTLRMWLIKYQPGVNVSEVTAGTICKVLALHGYTIDPSAFADAGRKPVQRQASTRTSAHTTPPSPETPPSVLPSTPDPTLIPDTSLPSPVGPVPDPTMSSVL